MDFHRDKLHLMKGDCLERMKEITSNSIDMVLADPPYGTTNCSWDSLIELEQLWQELNRVTKINAAIIMTAQSPFDKVLACSNLKHFRYEWIWEKGSATGFFNAKKMPLKAHENVLVFYKKLPKYNPQKTEGHARKSAMKGDIKSEVYGVARKRTWYDSTTRYPRSVQFFRSDKQKLSLHPTQKPVALMEYLIKSYTEKNQIVLDFCMGSGTTGQACINSDRKFIGIELEEKYFQIAKERLVFDLKEVI